MSMSMECSVCLGSLKKGDHIVAACVGLTADGEPIVNVTHTRCVDTEVAVLRQAIASAE